MISAIVLLAVLCAGGYLVAKHWPGVAAEFKNLADTGLNSLDESASTPPPAARRPAPKV